MIKKSSSLDTVYAIGSHITPGSIIKLRDRVNRLNYTVGARVDHTIYIWILRRAILKKNRPPKDRKYQIVFVWIPEIVGRKKATIIEKKSVQFDSLQTYIRKHGGYELISDNCNFTYKDRSIAKFYRILDLI